MGLRVGDRIVSFNGIRVGDWREFSDLIRANLDRPATVVVHRGGKEVTLPTQPTIVTGVPDRLNPSKNISAGFLGVTPEQALERGGPSATAEDLWLMSKQSAVGLMNFPVKTWHVLVDMVTGKPRDVNGPMSIVGASRTAGEIAATDQIPVQDRVAGWFMMLGAVNLFVALLNLIPLPPLDGGHMAGAIYDGLRRWIARVRGQSDPGHADTAKLLPIAYGIAGFLILAGGILIVADVISPVKIF